MHTTKTKGANHHEEQRQDLPPAGDHLACNWSCTLNFGSKVLLAGYFYSGRNANSYFGAVYEYTTDDHTCEGEIRLTAVSDEMFEDNGHAIAWAMAH